VLNKRSEPRNYDLHCHSTASDGTLSPSALVERAAANGVDVLALTDHDQTAGLDEAARAARRAGIVLVPGVEVSVTWSHKVLHIVGLRIDPDYPPLAAGLARIRAEREGRAEEMGRRLAKHGIAGALEGARRLAAGGIVTRTHFARYLVERGHAADVPGVFKRFLVRGKPGYVAGAWATLEEAVDWITGSGGQAVIAHPARYTLSSGRLRQLFAEFRGLGGVGVEVVSGSHGPGDVEATAVRARQAGLLASVGSDFHGPGQAYVELGRNPPLPPGVTPIWSTWPARAA
jgi:predicted metal-dependent phosphoesterase TrpH